MRDNVHNVILSGDVAHETMSMLSWNLMRTQLKRREEADEESSPVEVTPKNVAGSQVARAALKPIGEEMATGASAIDRKVVFSEDGEQ